MIVKDTFSFKTYLTLRQLGVEFNELTGCEGERITLCARVGRASHRGDETADRIRRVINFLFDQVNDPQHCETSYNLHLWHLSR